MILGIVFFGTLFFSIEFAILAGVILSLMIFLRKTSRPRLSPRVPDPHSKTRKFVYGQFLPECPQLKILRSTIRSISVRYRMSANCCAVTASITRNRKHLFLLTKGISQVDVAGAELLISETRERRAIGGDLYMYRLRDTAAKVFERGGYARTRSANRISSTPSWKRSRRFSAISTRIFARPAKIASSSNVQTIDSNPERYLTETEAGTEPRYPIPNPGPPERQIRRNR